MVSKILYVDKHLRSETLAVIDQANEIIAEYASDRLDLTLRQLYYQFVARGLLSNTEKNYKRLGTTVSDGRLAGLIDWEAIVDRTRELKDNPHWSDPASIVEAAADSYSTDKWANQLRRVEVWIEKEALAGVLQAVCPELDVDYFSCRGYVSQSEQWKAAMRLERYIRRNGQNPVIIHLGDHDPSGIDMTRDVRDRLGVFGAHGVEVRRIALNMDQIEELQPPPNPAKLTDSRAADYVKRYGTSSWELDALDPRYMMDLIRNTVLEYRDEDLWAESVRREEYECAALRLISDNYESVIEFVDGLKDEEGS